MKKQNIVLLLVAVFALSGFTWGETNENKKNTSKKSKKTASSFSAPKRAMPKSMPVDQAANPSGADPRAAAVRLLASGDEETRKARLESLSRLSAAMAKRNQQNQNQQQNQRSQDMRYS